MFIQVKGHIINKNKIIEVKMTDIGERSTPEYAIEISLVENKHIIIKCSSYGVAHKLREIIWEKL